MSGALFCSFSPRESTEARWTAQIHSTRNDNEAVLLRALERYESNYDRQSHANCNLSWPTCGLDFARFSIFTQASSLSFHLAFSLQKKRQKPVGLCSIHAATR